MALAKVFRIEMTGGRDVEKDIQAIRKAMRDMAGAIKQAKAELSVLLSSQADPTAVTNLTAKIGQLETQLKSLSQQRKNAETDAKRQAEVEKILADVKLKEAQATKVQAQADKERTTSQIAQEKELDRQIALEQKAEKQAAKNRAANEAVAGSYLDIKNALAQLRPFIQAGDSGKTLAFRGQNINFEGAIAEYKRLSFAEQDFRRQFQADGTLVSEYAAGIVNAFQRLNIDDIIRNQVTGAKEQLGTLEKKTNDLVVAYRKAQQEGSADLNKLEKEIHDNVVETENLRKSVLNAETQLKGMGGIGDQITAGIDRNFKSLKQNISQFALQYIGFQAIFSGLTAGVDNAKELSDQTTNLEVELGKASGGARYLVDQLSALNTRTKLTVLEDIANIAAKAGVSEDKLVGVTAAIDKIKIAFGKDFGDVEQGAESLVKLINIFLGTDQVTGDNLLRVGNAVRTLANESVASVPFLNDFSKRMAGLKGISDITLPSVLGLASGFEQFGQSAEVSSTALVKIIPKLATDIAKYAKVAGVSNEEFKKLLNNNPAEALIKVSQGLVQGKAGIEEISAAFADSELGQGRIAAVLGVLGKNADDFRKSINSAGEAFNDTGNIETAFAQKNENLAATLDKIGKKFADAAGSKGFQTLLLVTGTSLAFLIGNLGIAIPLILTVIGLTNTWAGSMVRLVAAQTLNVVAWTIEKAQLIVNNGLKAAAVTITNIYTVATIRSAAATGAAAVAYRLLAAAISFVASPLGILVGLVAVFTTVIGIVAASAKGAARQIDALSQVNKASSAIYVEQISKINSWIVVIKSAETSAKTKANAVRELIKIDKAFGDVMKDNVIDLNALDKAYRKVSEAIQIKARAEASAKLVAEKQQKVDLLELVKQRVETEFAQNAKGDALGFFGLSQEELNVLENTKGADLIRTLSGSNAISIQRTALKKVFTDLQKQQDEAIKDLSEFQKIKDGIDQQIEKAVESKPDNTIIDNFEVDIAKLKDQIKALDDQIEVFKGSQKDLTKLVAERKRLQELLDKALGNQKGGRDRASRLSGDQKDLFKDIDANRDRLLAEQKQLFLDLQIDEKEYLRNVLQINTDAIDQKLKLLKRKNAEERKIIAQLNLDKITNQKETNEKLFALDNKQLEVSLRNKNIAAQQQFDVQKVSPELNNTERLQANEDYLNQLLQNQVVFNQQQIAAEKLYGVVSIENEQKRKEAIEKIINDLREIERSRPEARLKDIREEGDLEIAATDVKFSKIRQTILNNDKITAKKRRNQLEQLDRANRISILTSELNTLKKEFDEIEDQLTNGLVTYEAFIKKRAELDKKGAELQGEILNRKDNVELPSGQNTQGNIQDQLSKLVGFASGSTEDQLLGNVIAESFSVAKEAMNGYFDAQQARIEQEKQLKLDSLDREKERLLAFADSQAEQQTIEKQYAQKKRQAEKEAGEQLKKSKRAEAKVALATELANIAVAAAANPLNGITLGAAGIAMYGLLAGLAFARYALNVNAINQQQFGEGGNLFQRIKKRFGFGGMLRKKKVYGLGGEAGKVPVRGGRFGGKSHGQGGTDFIFKGEKYNAEVDEMNVIRTKNAPRNKVYSITGNHPQIASKLNELGGGVSFQPGASVTKFAQGGQLGTNLRPPTFNNGYYSSDVNKSLQSGTDIEELKTMVKDLTAAVAATDKKPVVLDSKKVTDAQARTRKDVDLGTI